MLLNISVTLLFTSYALAITTDLSFVTIKSQAPYIGLRDCAQTCVFVIGYGLPSYIGCQAIQPTTFAVFNTCYCNTNFGPSATNFLSSCISSACSDGSEIANAITAYEGYCSGAGYVINVVAQTTMASTITSAIAAKTSTTVQQASASPTTSVTTPSQTHSQESTTATSISNTSPAVGTQNASSTPPASPSSHSNIGPIIGGAVGGALILGLAGIAIAWLILRERRRPRPAPLSAPTLLPAPSPPPPDEQKIATGPTSPRPFAGRVLSQGNTAVPEAGAPAGLIPVSPRPINTVPVPPPVYNESGGVEISEAEAGDAEPRSEMQATMGRDWRNHWEMQA